MIILVDNEHETGYRQPWGEKIMAARVRIKYGLEDITGQTCLIVRYHKVSPQLLSDFDVRAVFVSGNSAAPTQYAPEMQEGLRAVFREMAWPIFGFCGGFQTLAETYGAKLVHMGPLAAGEPDPHPDFAPGMRKELGYFPVQFTMRHPLLEGIEDAPTMRHAHSWEITTVPDGFKNYAATEMTPIQMLIHDSLPIIGTQFHPEYYTGEHPAGKRLIENFCRLAGLIE